MERFEKNKLEQDLEVLILETPAPGKHCARNSFRHLEKAWSLPESDAEMAAFRAITAEEEAASAVFHAIRKQKYIGWEKLNPRDHVQKNALIPFCLAIEAVLAEADKEWELRPRLTIDLDAKKIGVDFNPKKLLNPAEDSARCVPPLHFSVSLGEAMHDFSKQLADIATVHKAASINAYVRERANRRNQVLYASTGGIPNVSLNDFLHVQRDRVRQLLIIYLLIDLHMAKQDFVQQGLLAFLKMLGDPASSGNQV